MPHGRVVTLNFSSIFVQSYPAISPWDPSYWKDRRLETLVPFDLQPCSPFPDEVKTLALAQARRTGVNPFNFIAVSNPFFLDNPNPTGPDLPLDEYQAPRSALPRIELSPGSLSGLEQIGVGHHQCILRAKLHGEPRILKLYLEAERDAAPGGSLSGFSRELDAYNHLSHYSICELGAAPKCYGWLTLATDDIRTVKAPGQNSPVPFLREALKSNPGHSWKGVILEDLADFVPVSVHNVSGPVAQAALKALHKIHSAFVQHGNLDRQHLMLLPGSDRVVWVSFGHSSCGNGTVSRQSLFQELARAWSFLYQKLIPDAFLGFEDDNAGTELWKRPMFATPAQREPGAGHLQRVLHATVEEEIEAIVMTYPEKNVLDWNPRIHNLIPEPKNDHLHDSVEFLTTIKQFLKNGRLLYSPFEKWHGTYPLIAHDDNIHEQPNETLFKNYVTPTPLLQIPSGSPVEFLECLSETGTHPMLRVRLRGEERLLKAFSGGWTDPSEYGPFGVGKTVKERFEIEKSAYAHLTHYGACDAGAVPACYGWIELSESDIAKANALLAASSIGYRPGSQVRARPPFLDPIFADGSPAAALVLEYIPNTEVLETRNITYPLAESAMRAFTRIHGAYVQHGDIVRSRNILIVKGNPDRIVVVDFDHASDVSSGTLQRAAFRNELMELWVMMYINMMGDQRIERLAGPVDY